MLLLLLVCLPPSYLLTLVESRFVGLDYVYIQPPYGHVKLAFLLCLNLFLWAVPEDPLLAQIYVSFLLARLSVDLLD
jgi:hypothetical protein